MSFKGSKVWAQTDEKGNPASQDNKVLIKYNLDQDYEYKVKLEGLRPENEAVPSKKKNEPEKTGSKKPDTAFKITAADKKAAALEIDPDGGLPENCIKIYTDGASSGNPGPSGIGILFIYKKNKKEISRYIGQATNNIAELTAIKAALEELKRTDLPVYIFSDSSYSIGLLAKGWKPQKNRELVLNIRQMMAKFKELYFIKVKGHCGIKENEVADFLATSAIKKGTESI